MRVPSRRLAMIFTFLAAILGLALVAQSLAAQTPALGAGTDPAYAAGYRAGFPLGLQDQVAGAVANAHKFRLYQEASLGYTAAYGTPAAYRSAFQSGFADGYSDAFHGRRAALALNQHGTDAPATPPAAPSPANAAPPSVMTVARSNGYREGYNVGQADANRSAHYNAQASDEYRQAMVGYHSALGDASQYQLNFRSGFANGYSDGYYHRLYNTQMGARPAAVATAAAAAAAPGGNPLPPNPAALMARPSGVYDNGVFLAQGTSIRAALDHAIDTKTAQVGDPFSATVSVPVWVGAVAAIPAGSTIQGTVEQVSRGGKFSGNAQLQLQFTTITVPGHAPVALAATTTGVGADASNVGDVNGEEGTITGQGAGTAKHAGTGAAIGAVLGGIFGGGSGILKGGAAGAAAGTAGVLLTHKKDLVLDQGEAISLQLDQPLELPKP